MHLGHQGAVQSLKLVQILRLICLVFDALRNTSIFKGATLDSGGFMLQLFKRARVREVNVRCDRL